MKIKGPWDAERIERFLDESRIPARVGVLTPAGVPLVLSLWFLRRGDAIWCACNRRARIVEMLRRDPRCGFEIASDTPPYRGVRGQGRAQLDAPGGAEVLSALLARYRISGHSRLAGMLLKQAAGGNEVAIHIEPDWMTSWDFSSRMRDAFRD